MRRYAFVFRIKPELRAEYEKAHDEIWPDMARAIRDSGITNYSIFFRRDGLLFAYLEAEDPAAAFAYLGRQEVNARWQRAMEKYFTPLLPRRGGAKEDTAVPGPQMEELEEVFHID
jgi:L-rhamnose mutarotase